MTAVLAWLSDPGHQALAALALSIASMIGSIYAWRKSSGNEKRLLEIEESRERDRLEGKSKASLVANLIREPGGRDLLKIVNHGGSEAREILIKFDGQLLEHHPVSFKNQLPPSIVGAHGNASILLAVSKDCAPPYDLEMTWQDDSGQPGAFRTTLTS